MPYENENNILPITFELNIKYICLVLMYLYAVYVKLNFYNIFIHCLKERHKKIYLSTRYDMKVYTYKYCLWFGNKKKTILYTADQYCTQSQGVHFY